MDSRDQQEELEKVQDQWRAEVAYEQERNLNNVRAYSAELESRTVALQQAERELVAARADVVAAAGELSVPLPAPGTMAAKLLAANSIMRSERDEAKAFSARADAMRGEALSALGLMESDLGHAEARIAALVRERDTIAAHAEQAEAAVSAASQQVAVLIEAGDHLSTLGRSPARCLAWERAKGGAK